MSLYGPFHWPPLQIDRPPRWPFACVVHDDSPRGFFRVPLTQVYPMALPLPPSLSRNLSLALGWARNNLNIFGFAFFLLLRWVFFAIRIVSYPNLLSWSKLKFYSAWFLENVIQTIHELFKNCLAFPADSQDQSEFLILISGTNFCSCISFGFLSLDWNQNK